MKSLSPHLIDTVYLRPVAGDGRVPYGIAANPVTNLIYTANSATGKENRITFLKIASDAKYGFT